jgi:hypothetical protein
LDPGGHGGLVSLGLEDSLAEKVHMMSCLARRIRISLSKPNYCELCPS